MEVMSLPTSSPKRLKVSGSHGVSFSLSPQVVSKQAAISAKLSDPDHVDLRSISVNSLSVAEADSDRSGFMLCLSPIGTSSNKRLAQLLSIEQEYHVYVTLLGSSPKVCEVDLVAFVLRHLDYFLKKIVQEEMQKGAADFEDALVGPHKQRPFQETNGNNIRYGSLLLFMDRMQRSSPLDYAACARFSTYEDLLSRSENSLLLCLHASGACNSEEEQQGLLRHMREEIRIFLTGHMKVDRDIASHIFCDLLWVDNWSVLEDLDLEGNFPKLNDDAFDMSEPSRLEDMALKVLILKDLLARFGLNRIGKFTHEITNAALKLVHSCIQRNVKVSRKVICGAMEATIPGLKDGVDLGPVELDPPPGMSQLLRS